MSTLTLTLNVSQFGESLQPNVMVDVQGPGGKVAKLKAQEEMQMQLTAAREAAAAKALSLLDDPEAPAAVKVPELFIKCWATHASPI